MARSALTRGPWSRTRCVCCTVSRGSWPSPISPNWPRPAVVNSRARGVWPRRSPTHISDARVSSATSTAAHLGTDRGETRRSWAVCGSPSATRSSGRHRHPTGHRPAQTLPQLTSPLPRATHHITQPRPGPIQEGQEHPWRVDDPSQRRSRSDRAIRLVVSETGHPATKWASSPTRRRYRQCQWPARRNGLASCSSRTASRCIPQPRRGRIGAVILGDFPVPGRRPAGQPYRWGPLSSRSATSSSVASSTRSERPIDGLGDITSEGERVLELQAPRRQRQPVEESLATGIKAIDAMTAIGRGQRQLVIGNRQTGKTTVCGRLRSSTRRPTGTGDPDKQVRCIYVAIGQRARPSPVKAARRGRRDGVHHHRRCSRLNSAGFKIPSRRTPVRPSVSTGCTRASTSLIVFDDLTKQAEGLSRPFRCCACAPPGRGLPGDVFYLHSRVSGVAPSSPTTWAAAR